MLTPKFSQFIIDLHGETGKGWLEELPSFLSHFSKRWSLTLFPPFDNLSYNYVCPAIRTDGTRAVLKAHLPHQNSLDTEAAALHLYNGRGCARLLEADPDGGAILIERLHPGTSLSDLPEDDQATRIAAEVMRKLWVPLPAFSSQENYNRPKAGDFTKVWEEIGVPEIRSFPTTSDWAKGLGRLREEFNGGTGPYPAHLVEIAESLFAELHASQETSVLLHGDLHHYNILSSEREPWLAIDPKGLVGEPAYEIGAFLRNPIHNLYSRPDVPRITARRVDIFSEYLELDRQRVIAWSMAQNILSVWWGYEDHQQVDAEGLFLAEILAKLI